MTHAPASNDSSHRARVLVAEDDGPSGLFLVTAFGDMQCRVDLADSGQQALQLARDHAYDLLVLDCRMPDFGAIRILSALREDTSAASHDSPAVATSAEMGIAEQGHLRQIGFVDALLKPMALDTLREVVETWLPHAPQPLLDDATAIDNSGSAESAAALRKLFAHELSRLSRELDQQASQSRELSERLHRLLASCGFCGANALAEATRKLKRQLDRADATGVPVEMQQFREILSSTLGALTHKE